MTGSGVALVAGASSGFGRLSALALARRGFTVYCAYRDIGGRNCPATAALTSQAARERLQLEVVELDVRDDDSVARAVESILTTTGRIDALVNAAGFAVLGPWETISVPLARSQFETNFFGAWRLCQAVVPSMRERRSGSIVNVSSESGIRPKFREAAYAASKSALEAMTTVMRFELQQFGIRVSLVNPGWYSNTNFAQNVISTGDSIEVEAGPYGRLLNCLGAVREVGLPWPDPQVVADRIAEIAVLDDPPLHSYVGCRPLSVDPTSDDEYEEALFSHFEVREFHRNAPGRR